MPGASALRELRTLTRALQASLLTLLDAGVACQESAPTKFSVERLVRNREGSCNPVTERSGLTGDPAAVKARKDREPGVRSGRDKRPASVCHQGRSSEELVDRAIVAHDGAVTGKENHPGNRILSLPRSPGPLSDRRVNLQLDSFITMRSRRSGVGACASWGWASPA